MYSGFDMRRVVPATHCPLWLVALALWLPAASAFSQETGSSDKARASLDDYAKFVNTLQESRFDYTIASGRVLPEDDPAMKWNTQGQTSLSARRRSLHWLEKAKSVPADDKSKESPHSESEHEYLITPERALEVLGNIPLADDDIIRVTVNETPRADEWRHQLSDHSLAILLGVLSRDRVENGRRINEAFSPAALADDAKLQDISEKDDKLGPLAGFSAAILDYELRVLFDAQRHLRHVDVKRRDGKSPKFETIRITLNITDIQYEKDKPAVIRGRIRHEVAGGDILREELPENAVLTEQQEKAGKIVVPARTYELTFEANHFLYEEAPAAKWFVLSKTIPNETPIRVEGHDEPYVWQDGKPKPGFPPITDAELKEVIKEAFAESDTVAERYPATLREVKLTRQNCLLIFADPRDALTKSLYRTHSDVFSLNPLLNRFGGMAISLKKKDLPKAREFAVQRGVKLPDGPLYLVVLDSAGKVLGQVAGTELATADKSAIDPVKLTEFYKKHAPPEVDAKKELAASLEQARKENKRVLVQQSATWCGPCGMLTEYLDNQREIWEKDYVWLRIDESWLNSTEVMEPIRKNDDGGIPWMAILDAQGKTLATSDNADGENIGFPSPEEPAGIEHFINKMLKPTAQRMTAEDLQKLRTALEEE